MSLVKTLGESGIDLISPVGIMIQIEAMDGSLIVSFAKVVFVAAEVPRSILDAHPDFDPGGDIPIYWIEGELEKWMILYQLDDIDVYTIEGGGIFLHSEMYRIHILQSQSFIDHVALLEETLGDQP